MAASPIVVEWDAQGKPIQPAAASSNGATEWDASGKPISSGPDTRTLLQKSKDRFTAAQQRVAGAGPGGVPQLPDHVAPVAMQSSLLAPSTYTEAIKQTAKGLLQPLAHIPSQIESYGGFKNPADQGGPIQSIVNNPDKGAGVANALTQVGTAIALGKALEVGSNAGRAMAGKVSNMRGNSVASGQNYTDNHAAAFEAAIAPATSMGKNFIPQNVTPEALSPIRDTAAHMLHGSPADQGIVKAATDSSTPPLERIGAYQSIVQRSLNDLESQHAPALAKVANVPVDTSSIVQQLQSHISPTMAPADVSAIQELISRVKQAKTIGDLNNFRQELNVETAPEYRQSQIQAGRSGISSQATSDLAGWVRNAYYDNLQKATGTDFAPLKRQEANLMTVQEALQNQQSPLAKAEAIHPTTSPFNGLSTLKEKVGNVANLIKDPRATITQTILRESPATKISMLLQKSLGNLPNSASTVQAPTQQAQSGNAPTPPTLGQGQPPTVQGTSVNPFPPSGPPRLENPQGTIQAPVTLRGLPSSYRSPRLPSSTDGYEPTEASPSPQLNEATARMRVQPNQFTQPESLPSRGLIAVSPSGNATIPAKGLPAPETAALKATTLTGRALWAQQGAQKMEAHGVSASDLDALAKTAKGKQLLTIASGLTPGSPAMKNLVKQIPALLGK